MSRPVAEVASSIKDKLLGLARLASDSTAQFRAWAKENGIGNKTTCPTHGWITLLLDVPESAAAWRSGERHAVWTECEECRTSRMLMASGVAPILSECRFRTFVPENEHDHESMLAVRRFAGNVIGNSAGFLILSSPTYGNGKSHLAVAVMAECAFPGMMCISNAEFMRRLRMSYDLDPGINPVPKAKIASLLVFDDLGASGGGRDEVPALHEVFDHRFNRRLPVIITTNLNPADIPKQVGPRMADRFRQASTLVTLTGPSMRPKLRSEYKCGEPSKENP